MVNPYIATCNDFLCHVQDDYSYIMAEALADRLAEAVAEKVHEDVRREFWGYAPDEKLSPEDLLKVKYQVRAYILLPDAPHTLGCGASGFIAIDPLVERLASCLRPQSGK